MHRNCADIKIEPRVGGSAPPVATPPVATTPVATPPADSIVEEEEEEEEEEQQQQQQQLLPPLYCNIYQILTFIEFAIILARKNISAGFYRGHILNISRGGG